MTHEEFSIIARSMLAVFPRVTLWRGNFWADRPVIALMGHKNETPLATQGPLISLSRKVLNDYANKKGEHIPLISHYAGQIEANTLPLVDDLINTDNQPIIEYLAPINHRRERAGTARWFMSDELLGYLAPRLSRQNLSKDDFIRTLPDQWWPAIQAGHYLQVYQHLKATDHADSLAAKATYEALLARAAASRCIEGPC